jgi:glycosyltransferase involved in cell wall biosynthesis
MEIEREVHASAPGDVAILGFKQGAAMYLSGFDVFCLPSKKEGFPYAILEAGLAGLPVIASNVGGIPEIIADGVSGVLIDPTEPETLLNALDIMSNAELRTQLGIELKRRVQHIFTLDHMLEKTRALYES